ncbi:acyl-CoA dehydrogenase family protein [uncultured Roseibium sp.]|uniref:acyl-CoA dehydrogenase family protein n=1 Tax=uncultured Roseibium sp. TaxID=1936171 RepID=UPI00321684F5
MLTYEFPASELRYLMTDVFDLETVLCELGHDDLDCDTFFSVAETFGSFARETLLPLNAVGDREGAAFENGRVRAAPGFAEAYQAFCQDGWNGLACDPDYGGQGLPNLLHAAIRESMAGTNLSFSLLHELNFGVYKALKAHGSEALKSEYLPKIIDGSWTGTMCLTEPHCGTDLGLVRTRARAEEDGTWRISGTKIFITWGDHDLSDNIVHLVLARTAGAPAGHRGLSLFVVPGILPADGKFPGRRNTVQPVGIEEKMGIHGSPTCMLAFDDAVGWLVGEETKGLAHMFTMMNAARLSIGLQGTGIAEVALQSASAYAGERRQGRAPAGVAEPDSIADPLTVHPDIRRRLLEMRAMTEAGRAMTYQVGLLLDVSQSHKDPAKRAKAAERLSVLTPILKSALSDIGFEVANGAVQIYGGHGYIAEQGIEQLMRDVRIASIYEGTNAVQARDLVSRKLAMAGSSVDALVEELAVETALLAEHPEFGGFGVRLDEAVQGLKRCTSWMKTNLTEDPEAALAGACDYLNLFALALFGGLWGRMVRAAAIADVEPEFRDAKYAAATVFFNRILPRTAALEVAVKAGPVPGVPEVERAA